MTDYIEDDDLVSEADACEHCGERRVDRLVQINENTVMCETCKTVMVKEGA